MRVLFISHSYPRSTGDAAGNFLLHLARALGDEGVEVEAVAPSGPGLPAYEVLEGIPVTRFRYAPTGWERLAYTGEMAQEVRRSVQGKLALAGFLVAGLLAARRVAKRFSPDVVHAHWWFPGGLIATSYPSRHGVPIVTTMHGTDVRLARTVRAAQPLLRRVLRRSRAVSTVSRWLADEVRDIAPFAHPIVAPMPVSGTLFHPGDERLHDRLLFVGRLNAQKGIALLLDALARTESRCSLDVVGDGPDAPSLRAQAKSLGIDDRITWHGARTQRELAPFYRRASALVVPSIGEGLGLVTVEAQLSETPVIAFASGGVVDLITDEETGLLVPPGDVVGLAAAIDRISAAPQQGRAIGSAGRRAALARFAPSAAARAYAAIYRDVLAHS